MNDYFLTSEFAYQRVLFLIIISAFSAVYYYIKSSDSYFFSKLYFNVTDSFGHPLSGVKLYLHRDIEEGDSEPVLNMKTDKKGRCTISLLCDFETENISHTDSSSVYTYWLNVKADGYREEIFEVILKNGQTQKMELTLKSISLDKRGLLESEEQCKLLLERMCTVENNYN